MSAEDLSRAQIELLVDTAESFGAALERDIKKVPTLRGRTISLFWEALTRTSPSRLRMASRRLPSRAASPSACETARRALPRRQNPS